MKRLSLIVFSLLLLKISMAQDFDMYQRNNNDNFKLPSITWQMDYNEFDLLSKHFRMQHMFYAMILPGYAHFYAKDYTTGWLLFTSRMLVYSSFLYTFYYAYKHREDSNINRWLINGNVLWAEAGFVMANYFFDIIHGKYVLEKKQNMIRYKYSMKLQLSAVNSLDGKPYPALGIKVKF